MKTEAASTGFDVQKFQQQVTDLHNSTAQTAVTRHKPNAEQADALEGLRTAISENQETLKQRGITDIEKIRIDQDPARRDEMIAKTGRRTVPQIFIGERHVGGFDDLHALDRQGGLAPLLQGQ